MAKQKAKRRKPKPARTLNANEQLSRELARLISKSRDVNQTDKLRLLKFVAALQD